jgi:hypothetical protein
MHSEPQWGERRDRARKNVAHISPVSSALWGLVIPNGLPTDYAVGHILRRSAAPPTYGTALLLTENPHESCGLHVRDQERGIASSGDTGDALSRGVAAADRTFHRGRPSGSGPISG